MKCFYISKIELKCFCLNISQKVVWIVDHSFVKWAERRAEVAWEPNMGLQSTSVQCTSVARNVEVGGPT